MNVAKVRNNPRDTRIRTPRSPSRLPQAPIRPSPSPVQPSSGPSLATLGLARFASHSSQRTCAAAPSRFPQLVSLQRSSDLATFRLGAELAPVSLGMRLPICSTLLLAALCLLLDPRRISVGFSSENEDCGMKRASWHERRFGFAPSDVTVVRRGSRAMVDDALAVASCAVVPILHTLKAQSQRSESKML